MDFHKRSQTIEKTRKSFTCKYCTDKKKMPHRFSCFNIISCSLEEGLSPLNDFLSLIQAHHGVSAHTTAKATRTCQICIFNNFCTLCTCDFLFIFHLYISDAFSSNQRREMIVVL